MTVENQNSKYVNGSFSEIRTENRSGVLMFLKYFNINGTEETIKTEPNEVKITSDFMINPSILLDVPSEPILAHYI